MMAGVRTITGRVDKGLFCATALATMLGMQAAQGDEVSLRGSKEVMDVRIVGVNAAGVHVEQAAADGATLSVFGWDEVRGITSEDAKWTAAAAEYRGLADQLWRGRSRIERGDYQLAEPVLKACVSSVQGRKDRNAAVVYEGLLRAALGGDAAQNGCEAAAWWLRTREITVGADQSRPYSNLAPVFDERSGLCFAAPPVFPGDPADIRRTLPLLAEAMQGSAEETRFLAQVYEACAKRAIGEYVNTPARLINTGEEVGTLQEGEVGLGPRRREGTELAWALAAAGDERAEVREAAITVCTRWVNMEGPAAAWALYGRGMARLKSPDEATRKLGLVDLLALPTEHAGKGLRVLEAAGLRRAAEGLAAMQRDDAAEGLLRELADRYPEYAQSEARLEGTQPRG